LSRSAGPGGKEGLATDHAEATAEVVGEDDFKLWDEDIEDVFIEFAETGLAAARQEKGVLDIAVKDELGGGVAFVEGGDFGGPRGKRGHGGRGQVGEGGVSGRLEKAEVGSPRRVMGFFRGDSGGFRNCSIPAIYGTPRCGCFLEEGMSVSSDLKPITNNKRSTTPRLPQYRDFRSGYWRLRARPVRVGLAACQTSWRERRGTTVRRRSRPGRSKIPQPKPTQMEENLERARAMLPLIQSRYPIPMSQYMVAMEEGRSGTSSM